MVGSWKVYLNRGICYPSSTCIHSDQCKRRASQVSAIRLSTAGAFCADLEDISICWTFDIACGLHLLSVCSHLNTI